MPTRKSGRLADGVEGLAGGRQSKRQRGPIFSNGHDDAIVCRTALPLMLGVANHDQATPAIIRYSGSVSEAETGLLSS